MRSPLNSPPNVAGSESSTSAAAALGACPPADARAARAPPVAFAGGARSRRPSDFSGPGRAPRRRARRCASIASASPANPSLRASPSTTPSRSPARSSRAPLALHAARNLSATFDGRYERRVPRDRPPATRDSSKRNPRPASIFLSSHLTTSDGSETRAFVGEVFIVCYPRRSFVARGVSSRRRLAPLRAFPLSSSSSRRSRGGRDARFRKGLWPPRSGASARRRRRRGIYPARVRRRRRDRRRVDLVDRLDRHRRPPPRTTSAPRERRLRRRRRPEVFPVASAREPSPEKCRRRRSYPDSARVASPRSAPGNAAAGRAAKARRRDASVRTERPPPPPPPAAPGAPASAAEARAGTVEKGPTPATPTPCDCCGPGAGPSPKLNPRGAGAAPNPGARAARVERGRLAEPGGAPPPPPASPKMFSRFPPPPLGPRPPRVRNPGSGAGGGGCAKVCIGTDPGSSGFPAPAPTPPVSRLRSPGLRLAGRARTRRGSPGRSGPAGGASRGVSAGAENVLHRTGAAERRPSLLRHLLRWQRVRTQQIVSARSRSSSRLGPHHASHGEGTVANRAEHLWQRSALHGARHVVARREGIFDADAVSAGRPRAAGDPSSGVGRSRPGRVATAAPPRGNG